MLKIVLNSKLKTKLNTRVLNFLDKKNSNIILPNDLNYYIKNTIYYMSNLDINKLKVKAFKLNLLRYVVNILPENFFFLIIFKNFKKKKPINCYLGE